MPNYTDTGINIPTGVDFTVNEVSSGWLKIKYIENNHEIDGWIKCKDTNLCL